MARRTNRRKKTPNAAIPTYREDSKKASGPDPKLAIIALLLVVLLIGSGLYLTSIVEEAPEVSYGVEASLLTDNHKTQPGYDTDFVVMIHNTATITDTFDISIKSNPSCLARYNASLIDKIPRFCPSLLITWTSSELILLFALGLFGFVLL